MQIKFTKNTGNFSYAVTAEVAVETTDTVALYLLENGIVREIQGAPLGGWEKSIAYPGKSVKRPEGFTRTDIPFTPENADALRRALLAIEIEVRRNEKDEPIKADLGISEVVVTEYSGPEAKEPKFKAEKDLLNLYLFETDGKTAKLLKNGEARSAATFAENRGIAAPTEPWSEDTEFLANVKAWAKAQAAAQD